MSKEFEKKVLEKLDNFEGRVDKIEKTLNEHTNILNEHTNTLNEHTNILNEHTNTLNEHTNILNEHTEQFKKVRKDIYDVNNKIIKNGEYLKEMDLVIEYNTKYIKKYHEENTRKINLSLKAYEQLNSKVDMSKCVISALKSKNFENEVRINELEDQIKNMLITA